MKDPMNILRKNRIPQPNKYGVTKDQWIDNAKKNSIPDEIINAGLEIISFKEAVNELMSSFSLSEYNANDLLIAIIAISNRNHVTLKNGIVFDDRSLPITLEVKNNPPSRTTPDSILTKMIDSLRFSLCTAMQYAKGSNTDIIANDMLRLDICAQMMENCSQLWREVIWCGWHFQDKVFIEEPTDENIYKEAGEFRRSQFEYANHVRFRELLQQYPRFKTKSFYLDGKILKTKEIQSANPTTFEVGHAFAEDYYANINKINGSNGISVADIIEVWKYISIFAAQAHETLIDLNDEIQNKKDMQRFEISIRIEELISSISFTSSLTREIILKVVDFLKFDFKYETNLWQKPLIVVGDRIYIASVVFISARFRYLHEMWISQIGIDEKVKGTEFEDFVKTRVSHAASNDDSIKIYDFTDDVEEIDLAFAIGPKIYVCELKCNREPMDPEDYFNLQTDIRKASTQLDRKIKYLQNRKDLPEAIRKGICSTGLIVLNCFQYSGLCLGENVVVDHLSIFKYLEHSDFQENTVMRDGCTVKTNIVKFYTNKQEKADNFEKFLRANPLVMAYSKHLSQKDFPVQNSKGVLLNVRRPFFTSTYDEIESGIKN